MQLDYKKEKVGKEIESQVYESADFFRNDSIRKSFLRLKTNVCDLNPALVAKCVVGTEQDFIGLMNNRDNNSLEKIDSSTMDGKEFNKEIKRIAKDYSLKECKTAKTRAQIQSI